jgi:phosphonate transport system substrate-binding protein
MLRVVFSLSFIVVVCGCGRREAYRKVSLAVSPAMGASLPEKGTGKMALRVAVAPVISPRETLKSYSDLVDYLSQRLGRPAEIIQRSSYAEVNELVRSGDSDVAFVCSYAYLAGQRDFGMEALVVPQVKGSVHYYSYLIVPADSAAKDWDDLRGKVFAFSDPLSNSGHLAPRYQLMQRGETPEKFFKKTIFTYSHDKSIRAVADKLVDGAAVDSIVYNYMLALHPKLAKKTKVIGKSQPFGIAPVVVHPRINPTLRKQLKQALLAMHKHPAGRAALQRLMIDKFVPPNDRLYDSIREVAEKVEGRDEG